MRVDQGGEFWNIIIGVAVGAVVGAGLSFISQCLDEEASSISSRQFWAHVGVAAGAGAISGGLAASGVGIVGQVIGNAVLGVASSIVDTAIDDTGSTSFGTYALRAVEGAVLGALSGYIGGKGSASKHVSNSFWRMVGSGSDNLTYYFSQVKTQSIRDGIKAIPSIGKATFPSATKTFFKVASQRER